MTATARFADFITATTFESIPKQVVAAAKKFFLDGLGVSLGGCGEEVSRNISSFVRELGGEPLATVIGSGFKTFPHHAALANGTIAHALDYDDVALDWVGHPTAPVLPAVLALAEAHHRSGKEAVAAYIVGVEVESKLGNAIGMGHYSLGWHATATMGTLGAAAASANILRLDRHKTQMALGIAASLLGGLRQNFGTMTKPLHAGSAARNGVVAAMLAEKGFTADEGILEAPLGLAHVLGAEGDLDEMAAALGRPFHFVSPGIGLKLYPCCAETHRCIDAILYLIREHNLRPEQVEAVESITCDLAPQILIHSRPRTPLEGKFSMEFCMAIALLDGEVGLEQFVPEKLADPRCQELVSRVSYIFPEEMRGVAGLTLPQAVRVRLKDGREYLRQVAHARGEPENPPGDDDVSAKFRQCAGSVLPAEQVEQCLQWALALEELDDIARLMEVAAASNMARAR